MPVVDASVVFDWVAPDAIADSPAVRRLKRLRSERAEMLAPSLLRQEVGNALVSGVRNGRWSGRAADDAFRALMRMPVHIADDRRDMERAWELARRFDNHPLYDMVYIALAERHRTQLITADDSLRTRVALSWVVAP